jgi:HlyD family secretion protein
MVRSGRTLVLLAAPLAAILCAGCETKPAAAGAWQGYLEGETVWVAPPLAGRLDVLAVARGDLVTKGQPLFALERAAEEATRREAEERLRQAEAQLADLRRGQRPSEVATIEALLGQARAQAELAAVEVVRVERLRASNVAPQDDVDRARLERKRADQAVVEVERRIETARLGARDDALVAAEAAVAAARAALERAVWAVSQKSVVAPADGLVQDTLYRVGEQVAAGGPVVALLPPAGMKVRFFVPEGQLAEIGSGTTLQVAISGRASLAARVGFVAPQPEYTPPVLYNRDNRQKLVFLVEAHFTGPAADLHPGQPVDVTRGP